MRVISSDFFCLTDQRRLWGLQRHGWHAQLLTKLRANVLLPLLGRKPWENPWVFTMGKPMGNGLKLGNFSEMEDWTRNNIWFEWILAESHGEFMGSIVNNMILGFAGFVQELGCIPPTGSDQQPHHGGPQWPSEKDMRSQAGLSN